jgi:tetratricopeptide (TPR) repeat protein
LLALLAAQRTGTPDLEQERLRIMRDFFDQLADAAPGAVSTLDLPALRYGEMEALPAVTFRIALSAAQRHVLEVNAVRFELGRASLHARTRQTERAIALLEATVAKRPRLAEAYGELAIVRARIGDFAGAERAVQRGLAAAPAHRAIVTAQRAIGAAQQITAQLSGEPVRDALVRAQIDLVLGANASARVQLDHALIDHPDEIALIAMRARVDAIDRRPDLALARIVDAKRNLPEAAARLEPLELELRTMLEPARSINH